VNTPQIQRPPFELLGVQLGDRSYPILIGGELLSDPTTWAPQANRKHRDTEAVAIKKEVVRPVRTKAAVVPVEAPKPKPKLRTAPIQVGMDRQQLIELWGLPDMKTSSSQGGHLIENFAYASRSRPMQTVVLEDGLVVAAGTN